MKRIGIPRALLYYQYQPMWRAFFEALGAEVVLSPPTNRSMLAAGAGRVVTETCLPVKVFLGHVLSMADKCDCLFIPAVRSVKRHVYNCAKFLGLPDMTRIVVPEAPPILLIEFDVNRGRLELYRGIYELGRFFTWNPAKIRRAALAAWQAHLDYKAAMSGSGLMPPDILEGAGQDRPPVNTQMNVALIGHPYVLYDDFINHRLLPRLKQAGARLLTPEMIGAPPSEVRSYWTYEDEVVGAGTHYLKSGVDGIIGVMAFGCGPDSLMMDNVARQAARRKDVPFMCLTLEEHTAEAGILTRLEAFLDMISRRRRRQVALCV